MQAAQCGTRHHFSSRPLTARRKIFLSISAILIFLIFPKRVRTIRTFMKNLEKLLTGKKGLSPNAVAAAKICIEDLQNSLSRCFYSGCGCNFAGSSYCDEDRDDGHCFCKTGWYGPKCQCYRGQITQICSGTEKIVTKHLMY